MESVKWGDRKITKSRIIQVPPPRHVDLDLNCNIDLDSKEIWEESNAQTSFCWLLTLIRSNCQLIVIGRFNRYRLRTCLELFKILHKKTGLKRENIFLSYSYLLLLLSSVFYTIRISTIPKLWDMKFANLVTFTLAHIHLIHITIVKWPLSY